MLCNIVAYRDDGECQFVASISAPFECSEVDYKKISSRLNSIVLYPEDDEYDKDDCDEKLLLAQRTLLKKLFKQFTKISGDYYKYSLGIQKLSKVTVNVDSLISQLDKFKEIKNQIYEDYENRQRAMEKEEEETELELYARLKRKYEPDAVTSKKGK